jgi:hypothetical protein
MDKWGTSYPEGADSLVRVFRVVRDDVEELKEGVK